MGGNLGQDGEGLQIKDIRRTSPCAGFLVPRGRPREPTI
jgi:hypothetical protein